MFLRCAIIALFWLCVSPALAGDGVISTCAVTPSAYMSYYCACLSGGAGDIN